MKIAGMSPPQLLDEVLLSPRAALLIMAASVGALLCAFIAQYVFDLQPCILCIWQRIPFAVSIVFMGGVLASRANPQLCGGLFLSCALAMLINVGLAIFHTGVEQHWWTGTTGCAIDTFSMNDGEVTAEKLRQALKAVRIISCDKITWSFLGLSMANWLIPFSAGMTAFALLAAYATNGKKFSQK
ncbi:MAG: disulfide bond formation protein B [Alphaproteobacteria bacterium]|nr:disulfide bond formation protein B [Alphaproteobacteria bacterium]